MFIAILFVQLKSRNSPYANQHVNGEIQGDISTQWNAA